MTTNTEIDPVTIDPVRREFEAKYREINYPVPAMEEAFYKFYYEGYLAGKAQESLHADAELRVMLGDMEVARAALESAMYLVGQALSQRRAKEKA